MTPRTRTLPTVPALIALLLAACQTITEEMPRRPATSLGAPGPIPSIVIVQIPIPSPVPVPSPAAPNPAPAPTAAPPGSPNTPAPTPQPPTSQGCSLPPGNGSGNNCIKERPSFLGQVESAMDQLVREEPRLFDLTRTRGGCGNCYFVVDPTRYTRRMAELMSSRGLCGYYDGEELAVKNSNSFNDQYDILTSDLHIRRNTGSYEATCYPAWF